MLLPYIKSPDKAVACDCECHGSTKDFQKGRTFPALDFVTIDRPNPARCGRTPCCKHAGMQYHDLKASLQKALTQST